MPEKLEPNEIATIRKSLVRFNQQGWGLAFGSVCGLGLLTATLWLVVRGGVDVGAHLELLAVFLPGYSVSVVGSLVGFVYAFVIGYGAGRTIAAVYNRLSF